MTKDSEGKIITYQTLDNTLDCIENREGALAIIVKSTLKPPNQDALEKGDELDILTQIQFDHGMIKKAN